MVNKCLFRSNLNKKSSNIVILQKKNYSILLDDILLKLLMIIKIYELIKLLNIGYIKSKYSYRALLKNGNSNFSKLILEYCDKCDLLKFYWPPWPERMRWEVDGGKKSNILIIIDCLKDLHNKIGNKPIIL